MRAWISILTSLVVLAAAGCGGGGDGGGGSPSSHPPAIANLGFAPAVIYQAPGATATVQGSFGFSDAGGDVVAVRMTTSAGADLTLPVSAPGMTSGNLVGTVTISAADLGHYTFEVWVTDSAGAASNRLSGSVDVVPDDRASNWTTLSASPPAMLYGVTRGGGLYVAVGTGGTVMTSSDLANWATPSTGVAHELHGVAWSASSSRFVVVGNDAAGEAVILSSDDGTAWTLRQTAGECTVGTCASPARLSRVIWTGTQFVAVGQATSNPGGPYALVFTSPDGLIWTRRAQGTVALGISAESAFQSVAWSGSQLVAVGLGPDSYPAAWTSTDAENWTRQTVPGDPGQVLRDITWSNGRFVAVGMGSSLGTAFRSTDGVTWQGNTDAPMVPAMNAVASGPTRFLMLSHVFIGTSSDAQTWTTVPAGSACGNAVIWDGTRYLAVGSSICRSP